MLTTIDHAIRRLAMGQAGVFSAEQARCRGASPALIRWRVRTGAWEKVVRGVYRLPGAPEDWRQRLWVAVLVAGPGAVLCRRTAAALWGLPGFVGAPIELLAPHGRKNHRLPGVIFHESRRLPDSQIKTLNGLPVTTLERTLFDLAGTGHVKRPDRATDSALVKRMTTTDRLWEVWADLAAPNRPGTTELRRILLKRAPGYVAKESELEHRFSELLEGTDLERPEWQTNLGGEEWVGRVDAYFRRARLVIELDGRVGHVGDLDRARDRQRDNELMADGWRVLRFTWDDLVSRPAWVLSTLQRALAVAA